MVKLPSGWRDVVWREWRNTEDREFAEKLFALVAEEPAGAFAAVASAAVGFLAGLLFSSLIVLIKLRFLWAALYADLGAHEGVWGVGGALLGSSVGILVWRISRRLGWARVTWKNFLEYLTPQVGPKSLPMAMASQVALLTGVLLWFVDPKVRLRGVHSLLFETAYLLSVVLFSVSLLGLTWGAWELSHRASLVYEHRLRWFWWRRRPHPFEVERSLQEACLEKQAAAERWSELLDQLEEGRKHPSPVSSLTSELRNDHWGTRFVARQLLAASGSKALDPLCGAAREHPKDPVGATAAWLLSSIASDTTSRLAANAAGLLCPSCFVRCASYTVQPSLRHSHTGYGCRACGQSWDFMEWPGKVVAVLDRGMSEDLVKEEGVLSVNWIARKSLFDFDSVEIRNGSDEEVERFAVQIGNDTDPVRKPRYSRMTCRIPSPCSLSENSVRILQSAFGDVARTEPVALPGDSTGTATTG